MRPGALSSNDRVNIRGLADSWPVSFIDGIIGSHDGRNALRSYADGDETSALRSVCGGLSLVYGAIAAGLEALGAGGLAASIATTAGIASPPAIVFTIVGGFAGALSGFYAAIAAGGDFGEAVAGLAAGIAVASGVVSSDDVKKAHTVYGAHRATQRFGAYKVRTNKQAEELMFRAVLGMAPDANGGEVSSSSVAAAAAKLEADSTLFVHNNTMGTHGTFFVHKAAAFFEDWRNAGKPMAFWTLVSLLRFRFSGATSVVNHAVSLFPHRPPEPSNVNALRGSIPKATKERLKAAAKAAAKLKTARRMAEQGKGGAASASASKPISLPVKLAAGAAAAFVVGKVAGVI